VERKKTMPHFFIGRRQRKKKAISWGDFLMSRDYSVSGALGGEGRGLKRGGGAIGICLDWKRKRRGGGQFQQCE